MRKNVTFDSASLNLAGHLYIPDEPAAGPRPAVVVGHPASGVQEQTAGLCAAPGGAGLHRTVLKQANDRIMKGIQ